MLLLSVNVLSCNGGEETSPSGTESTREPGFGIYLVDSGEPVLTGQHIEAYYRNVHLTVDEEEDTHALELNEAGIEQWNSFMTYEGIPQLKDTLYKKDFVFRVEGKDMYRGKFYSMASSDSYDGVVILDALFKLNEEHNRIYISNGYVSTPSYSNEDPRNSPEIIDFLTEQGLLR